MIPTYSIVCFERFLLHEDAQCFLGRDVHFEVYWVELLSSRSERFWEGGVFVVTAGSQE